MRMCANIPRLRLDYGGLEPFGSIQANMYFFSHLVIFQLELHIIR